MKHLVAVLVVLALAGCTKYIVRDQKVYQAELNQYDSWATGQAALLKGYVEKNCTCGADKNFTDPSCTKAADFILTIEARAPWHKAMSLYLGGIIEDRPSEVPPEIPANSTLCPEGGE